MKLIFQIGNFCFKILSPEEIPLPSNLMKFQVKDCIPMYTYEIEFSNELNLPDGIIISKHPDLLVFKTSIGENRLLSIAGAASPYALYQEINRDKSRITISSHWVVGMCYDTIFTSLLALERQMIKLNSLVFHCAYTRHKEGAILFSAPSETGKSTQAALWQRYRGSETINGDRALLSNVSGDWVAQGWPVCGSSEICHNISTPIRAIVMLSQSKENRIEQLSSTVAFPLIFGQTTVNRWNSNYIQRSIDLLTDLINKVPIFRLECTISEEAVKCLEQVLYRDL